MGRTPEAKFRCTKCSFTWQGYRVLWHECRSTGPSPCPPRCPYEGKGFRQDGLGMTECPKCKSIYVEFVNWEEVRKGLGKYWEE